MQLLAQPQTHVVGALAIEAVAFDANPLPAWIFDRESRAILAVNTAAVRRYGYAREEFLTLTISDLRAPEDVPPLLAFLARLGEEGTNPTRWRHRTKDGTPLEVEVVWQPLRFAGRPAVLVFALDVTARAMVEDDARRVHRVTERLRRERQLLLDSVAEGIVGLDAAGLVSFVNLCALQLLGYRLEEVIGRNLHTLVHDRYPDGSPYPLADCPIYQAFHAGRSVHLVEETLWRKDGTPLAVLTSVSPILEEGELVGGVAILADATEWRAREELRHEVLVRVAHDLANPLTAIKVQAQLLQQQAGSDGLASAGLHAGLGHIASAASRAARIVDELVDTAGLELGHGLELRLGPVNLATLVAAAVAAHQATTEEHRIVLETVEPSLVGHWDATRLERVVDNLLGNAVKYSPGGGTIVVSLAPEQDGVGAWGVLAVRDEGVGIPAADLPHLFERYHRGGNVAGIAGTGIGLASARQIIAQHGGTITVTSSQGVGTTFVVRLPLPSPEGPDVHLALPIREETPPDAP